MNQTYLMKLKEYLDYNPTTGEFTWIKKCADKVVIGSRAGSLNKDTGYRFIRFEGKRYREHRLAFLFMEGYMPEQVDHLNHIRNDNRWCNLKASNSKDNGKNQPKTKRNSTGFVGVSISPNGKYYARIYANKTHIHLGTYDTLDEAIEARKQANLKYDFNPNHGT